jgi:nitrate/nitrite transport system permease protein
MRSTTIGRRAFDIAWMDRLLATLSSDNFGRYFEKLARALVVPLVAILIFLGLWSIGAKNVQTSLGQFPGPVAVWEQGMNLLDEHQAERAKEAAFNERMQARVEKAIAAGKSQERIDKIASRQYTGPATFLDQILTSLLTVGTGFLIGSLIAIPIGILCGMNATFYQAMNPIIQVFKPVSPLAWLPLVTMVVSALYVSEDPMFDKAFLN